MFTNSLGSETVTARLSSRWFDLAVIAGLIALVSVLYGVRLDRQPLVGEETRWATGAREMLATGDWIVPRQQGRVFPERPPMTMWAMAAVGRLRGQVDTVAVRLPSVLAVVLTVLLIYGYTRLVWSRFAAVAAALVYASMGQVLQIGRLGESEALFALLVAASLMVWHLGYLRGWPPLAVWTAGWTFAGLAALVKGPQAPVYFAAITAIYLLVRRDWRYLVRWQYAAGAAAFAMIIAAWQIPFYLSSDWSATVATWSGLAADRIHLRGMAKHMAVYPLETFACLLPWSPLLATLMIRDMRAALQEMRPVATFLLTAPLVAYPSVWMAAGARGRYFMPLYPIIAVLIGVLIERASSAAAGSSLRRMWHGLLLASGLAVAAGAAAIGVCSLFPPVASRVPTWLPQPLGATMLVAIIGVGVLWVLWSCYRSAHGAAPAVAVLAVALFAGTMYAGVVININSARWNDPAAAVAHLKQHLPAGARLVSFTPIDHRFAYYFRAPIAELDWPAESGEPPAGVEYFCFMRNPGDTSECRIAGRGRIWTTTCGSLPFDWQEVTSICVERRLRDEPQRTVVLGRVVRPAAPQRAAAQPPVAQIK